MKKLAVILLAVLLCVSAVGCAESQRVQSTFQASAEGSMIGKTFQEVEAAFGPFSMVYLEADWMPMYLFSKTNVGFYFGGVGTPSSWAAMLQSGTTLIPAAVALQTVRSTDVCTGVVGRISDFGISEGDINSLSQYLNVFQLKSYDTNDNTVYTVTTGDQTLDVYVLTRKGSKGFTGDDQVRVVKAGTAVAAGSTGTGTGTNNSSRKLPQYNGADVTSISQITVGTVVTFGVYEQDNDLKNGAEPLQWRVLKTSGKRMLLITEKIIDARSFNDKHQAARWRNSDIRTWLNGEFMTTAFTEAERALIPQVELLDSGNDYYGIIPGSETKDRVFLLQAGEAASYFKSDEDRQAVATKYANARGFSNNPDGWWWLRNAGEDLDHAALVYRSGSIYYAGDAVERTYIGVRPALWVQLP